MDLILWRHADAEDGPQDMLRALTGKGRKEADLMAAWLLAHLPKHKPGQLRVLVSPALRTLQTADALGMSYEKVNDLAPGADAAHVLHAAGWPDGQGTVLVVGHQPTLGQTASLLLFGEPQPMALKKAGLVWLTHRVRGVVSQTLLKVSMSPEFA